MLKIGITGGIGSGKSTVCKVFSLLNIPIYNTDEEAKKLLYFNDDINTQVVKSFGDGVLGNDKLIDRSKLAEIVFTDKEKLNTLNNIIHPAVAEHFNNWCRQQKNAPYVLKEAAILFESGAYKAVDKVISVVAPVNLKIERTIKRDNTTAELVQQRMNNQTSDEEKTKRSDFVIKNTEKELLIPQIIAIHEQLTC